MRRHIFLLLVIALFVSTSAAIAEELHFLGAILPDAPPDWAQPSPFVELENPGALDDFADNSAGLPPVGNQGGQGSCTAWASAYYYLTYLQGRDFGWDLSDPHHQASPSFCYNQINGGGDNGSNPFDAFHLFEELGCGSKSAMPYTDQNCTNFPSESAFRSGIPFRTMATFYFDTHTQSGLQSLRNHLANGEIAVTAIDVYPNFDNIAAYDYNYCINDVYGAIRGGHCVAIIGFDENRVTSDGVGAFKMVNSWGAGWGQQGFWWMSNEAFLNDLIGWGYALYSMDREDYEPQLVVSIEPVHSDRLRLRYDIGLGTSDDPGAHETFFDFGGGWGVTALPYPENACIVLDMTDFYNEISFTDPNDMYVSVTDTHGNDGRSGSVLTVTVEDIPNGHYANCYGTPTAIPDNSNSSADMDMVLYHAAVPPEWLNAEIDLGEGEATLNWPQVPGGPDFLGYNIYRGGQLVGFTEQTQYTDPLPGFGVYDYQVASLWEPCPSWPSETMSVNFISPVSSSYPELPLLDGGTGEYSLTWEQLRPYQVLYHDGTSEQNLYLGPAAQSGGMLAQRFDVSGNGKLLKVSVFFTNSDLPSAPVRFRVYSCDESGQPGQELVTTPEFTPAEGHWKTMNLWSARPTVSAGEQVWIAVVFSHIETSPVGMDANSPGSGKLISPDGVTWMPFDGGGSMLMTANFGEEELVGGDTGLLGFQVFRDGEMVGEVSSNAHQFQGILPGAGTYTWRVDAVYQQGVWTGPEMSVTWDGFTEVAESSELPREYSIGEAYPNPFNSSTTINVNLPAAHDLSVRVYNMLGQQVAELAHGRYAAGSHRVYFDAAGYASGVYIVQAVIPGYLNKQMKIVYLR